jgi:hypothetical protein
MACRIAQQKWIDKIVAVDLVDERLERALAHGVQVIAPGSTKMIFLRWYAS